MEQEKSIANLMTHETNTVKGFSGEIGKSKKIVSEGVSEEANKKSFKNVFQEMLKEEKKDVKSVNYEVKKLKSDENYIGTIKEEDSIGKRIFDDKSENEIEDKVRKLANGFGIPLSFMFAILDSLGIELKDLLDPKKQKLILQKLARYLGINESKMEELYKEIFENRAKRKEEH